MSKHTTEENKVEDLLRTLTNSDEITVSNIEQPFVQFTAQEGIVQAGYGQPAIPAASARAVTKGHQPGEENQCYV